LIKRKQQKKCFLYEESVLILAERKKKCTGVGDDANETKSIIYKREKKDKYEKKKQHDSAKKLMILVF